MIFDFYRRPATSVADRRFPLQESTESAVDAEHCGKAENLFYHIEWEGAALE